MSEYSVNIGVVLADWLEQGCGWMHGKGYGMASAKQRSGRREIAVCATEESVAQPGGTRVTRAIILTPPREHVPPEIFPSMYFALAWQLTWLYAHVSSITLVSDDPNALDILPVPPSDSTHAYSSEQDIVCLPWSAVSDSLFSGLEVEAGALTLLLVAPFITSCDLGRTLREHVRADRAVTCLCERSNQHTPMLYIISNQHLETFWSNMAAFLPDFATRLAYGLPLADNPVREFADFALIRTGCASELKHCEKLLRIVPLAGTSPSAMSKWGVLLGSSAKIARSARFRGPVLVGTGAIVGEDARIGPWVVIGPSATIAPGAWIERSTIGASAVIEEGGCVYASMVGRGAVVKTDVLVLKARLDAIENRPILLPAAQDERVISHGYMVAKRSLDLVLALVALVALAPVLVVVALLCLLDSGWPMFFLHERLGYHGRRFRVVKFRTMQRDAHLLAWHPHIALESTPTFKLANDPRVTRLGRILRKTSIDELPQLINVLRGEMSLVGPRPIISQEVIRYGIYASDLTRVLPGMTGLWQVSGRSTTTYAQRVTLDVKYGDTCSFWTDVSLLLRTPLAVLLLRGAQ